MAVAVAVARDLDVRRFALAVELQRVADEILNQLPHLERVGVDRRQRADFDAGTGLLDAHFQIRENLVRHLGKIDRGERLGLRGHPRIGQQALN